MELLNNIILARTAYRNAVEEKMGVERTRTALCNVLLSGVDEIVETMKAAGELKAKVADLQAEVDLREAEIGDMLAERKAKAELEKPKAKATKGDAGA